MKLSEELENENSLHRVKCRRANSLNIHIEIKFIYNRVFRGLTQLSLI